MIPQTLMKSILHILPCLALAALLSCAKEPLPRVPEAGRSGAEVRLRVLGAADAPEARSALVSPTQPDAIYDINVWQYSQGGRLLAAFYVDGLSATSGEAVVGLRADIWSTDRLVVVANAGRALEAPASASQRVTFPYAAQATPSGYMGVLAVGTCDHLAQDSESNIWTGTVPLQRAMARMDIQLALGSSLTVWGASFLSGGVRVTEFTLRDSPAEFSFVPSSPSTVQSYTLAGSAPRADLDRLPSFVLPDGGTVSGYQAVYALPNLQGIPGSGWLTAGGTFSNATTATMTVLFTEDFGGFAPGPVAFSFLPAGDNKYADLVGGRNYRTTLTLENACTAGSDYAGRRCDCRFRVLADNACEVGEEITVALATPAEYPAGSGDQVLERISLSPTSLVHDDGVFRITGAEVSEGAFTDRVSGALVGIDSAEGVRLAALVPGESTLYYTRTFRGTVLTGSIALKAVRRTGIDVGGDDDGGGDDNNYD